MSQTLTSCPFCSDLNFEKRVLFENPDFMCVEDLWPVSKHHFLLVSKRHVVAMGHLDCERLSSLESFALVCRHRLGLEDTNLQLFERGNVSENVSGRPSVDHAHAHMFLGVSSVLSRLPPCSQISGMMELRDFVHRHPYFYYYELETGSHWVGTAEDLPSQFIRRVVGDSEGNANWNWRVSEASGA